MSSHGPWLTLSTVPSNRRAGLAHACGGDRVQLTHSTTTAYYYSIHSPSSPLTVLHSIALSNNKKKTLPPTASFPSKAHRPAPGFRRRPRRPPADISSQTLLPLTPALPPATCKDVPGMPPLTKDVIKFGAFVVTNQVRLPAHAVTLASILLVSSATRILLAALTSTTPRSST